MTPEPFLLNVKNADFVLGQGPKPTTRGIGCLILFCSVFLMFGIPFFGFVGREWYIWGRLHVDGVETEGVVTALEDHSDSEGSSYQLGYSFQLPGGKGTEEFRQRHQIGGKEYSRLSIGGPATVMYSKSDPTYSRAAGAPWQRIMPMLAMTGFLAVWSAIPLWLLVATIRVRAKERQLVAKSTIIPGQIVAIRQKTDSDGDLKIEIDYVFTDPDGRREQATASNIRNDLKTVGVPVVGTSVRVLFASGKNFELL